jgi:hypothetical protein
MNPRSDAVRWILKRYRYLQVLEDPADRGGADPVTEFQQFALDPLVSPPVVLGGEPFDERGDLGADRRPACPLRGRSTSG